MTPLPVRVPLRAIALSAALLVGVACSTEINTPQSMAFGTYKLRFINGDTLPVYTGDQDGFRNEVLSGTIHAKTDQTCEVLHSFRLTSTEDHTSRVVSETEACTWQLIDQGFHIRFPHNGALLSALFAQNALWIDFPDGFGGAFRFMYERTGNPPS